MSTSHVMHASDALYSFISIYSLILINPHS